MNKLNLAIVLLTILNGCSNPPDLSNQLKTHFSSRLAKIDSAAIIDSFRIIGIDSSHEKMGKIIDDTIYIRLLHSVQAQLAHALTRKNKDSIEYFQDEIKYMSGQIDTLTNSISTADTVRKYGILVRCFYQISKDGRRKGDSIYYFFDNKMHLLDSDLVDSLIILSYRQIK